MHRIHYDDWLARVLQTVFIELVDAHGLLDEPVAVELDCQREVMGLIAHITALVVDLDAKFRGLL